MYVTVDDYLDRFSQAEAVRITDTSRSGQPDVDKIQGALVDQSTYADAFLGSRYSVPIVYPPEMLRKVVADLAREQLHGTRPTDAVTLNADRARALLKDLSAGRATLPAASDADAPPEATQSGYAQTSNDARPRVFTSSSLADFTDLSGGYGGTVFDGPRGW